MTFHEILRGKMLAVESGKTGVLKDWASSFKSLMSFSPVNSSLR